MKKILVLLLIFLHGASLYSMTQNETVTIFLDQGMGIPYKLEITRDQFDDRLNFPGLTFQIDNNTFQISDPNIDPRALKAIISDTYLNKLSNSTDPNLFDIYENTARAIFAHDVVRKINRLRRENLSLITKTE